MSTGGVKTSGWPKGWKEWYAWSEDMVSGGLLFTGITMLFYGVIMRYVFNDPIAWVDEISKYLIIWGAYIGMAVALRDKHHIRVDMLYEAMPESAKRWTNLFADAVGLLFCTFLVYHGSELVLNKLETGQESMDVGVPLWIVYSIMPISGVLFGVRFIENVIHHIRDKQEEGGHDFDPTAL